jgi:hypothetical protein
MPNYKRTMKLKHAIFFFCITLTAISCSNMKENNHARIIWDKYDNGNYKTVHQYLKDTADMNDDYYYQEFYENGNLKIQGLENQRTRKGEWKVYYDNGDLKAKFIFENNVLNGQIELYDKSGSIKAKGFAKNGRIYPKVSEINTFIYENFNISENRPNWNDSLGVMVDSLKILLKKK